jgi:class 3 adenylate cyclase
MSFSQLGLGCEERGDAVAKQMRRKNPQLLEWLRAFAVGGVTWFALSAMHVNPGWLSVVVAVLAGAITLSSAELGVMFGALSLSVPMMATNPLIAIAFIILVLLTERYLGSDGGRIFLLIGLALVGAWLGPVWAAAALAGCLLGSAEGALAAALACVTLEVAGILTGQPAIGVTITGGTGGRDALLRFAQAPETLLSGGWFVTAFGSISGASVGKMFGTLGHTGQAAALTLQPLVWALGALVAGLVAARTSRMENKLVGLAAPAVGVTTIAIAQTALLAFLRLPINPSAMAFAFATSLVVAVGLVALWAYVFPLQKLAKPMPVRKVSMAAEDADVDELLRLISTAEDKLASQHTSVRVVLITDMKSFSRMTEEDGSVSTAKAIQRHRDLLIPVITRFGGCGKSTGGDGVVAAFESPASAIKAAAEAQRALAEHNLSHANEREIFVRMGLAAGEVVLDNGGRPFIGAALNLAARVMNLADGGQILATGDVVETAGSEAAPTHSFGEFELKNIAKPVEVVEILWADGQEPHDPRVAEVHE